MSTPTTINVPKFDISSLPVTEKAGKFTFKVPDTHPEAGKKIEKGFTYHEVAKGDTKTAEAIILGKGWDLVDMVNDTLKQNSRSNAYQTALLPYKPSEVSEETVQERMIRDYVRMGMSEDMARATVVNTLKALAEGKLTA
jgi:hypothetical protein